MIFKQIPIGPMQNFAYIIGDEETKLCAIVDPGWEINKLLKISEELKLKVDSILITHTHFDHINGVNDLVKKTSAKIYVHEKEAHVFAKLKDKVMPVNDNGIIRIGNRKIRVIHTKGHSLGAICFFFENKLITGDTLFVNAVGRTDLPGGNAEQLFESLQKLKILGDNVEVYPGHDYGERPFSTIGKEKKDNPYFMCDTKEQFLCLR